VKCPDEVEHVLLQVIEYVLLNIRHADFVSGDLARCGAEADHAHNLPRLLKDYSVSALRYYLGPCRTEYLRAVGQLDTDGAIRRFQPLWQQLEKFL
jgi:hypothetical protein